MAAPDGSCSDAQHDADDEDLDDGERGHRTDDALLSVLQHRDADDLGARFLQEDDRVVVVEDGDEHEQEGCDQKDDLG